MNIKALTVLVGIILISGCADMSSEDLEWMKKAMQEENANHCEKINSTMTKNMCFSTIANKKGDENICRRILEIDTRDSCYLGVASITRNPEICRLMNDTRNIEDCTDMVKNLDKEIISHLFESSGGT